MADLARSLDAWTCALLVVLMKKQRQAASPHGVKWRVETDPELDIAVFSMRRFSLATVVRARRKSCPLRCQALLFPPFREFRQRCFVLKVKQGSTATGNWRPLKENYSRFRLTLPLVRLRERSRRQSLPPRTRRESFPHLGRAAAKPHDRRAGLTTIWPYGLRATEASIVARCVAR